MRRVISVLTLAVLATAAAAAGVPSPPAKPWLGIVIADAPEGGGAQVVAVVPGGPADDAGLRAGDVLIAMNGVDLGGRAQLSELVHALQPGEKVAVRLRRGAREESVVLVPRDRGATLLPGEPFTTRTPVPGDGRFLTSQTLLEAGFDAADIPKPLRVHYGAPPNAGVLVTRVEPELPAAASGLRVGDLLVSLEGKPIESLADFDRLLFSKRQGAKVEVGVIRAGKPVRLAMIVPAGAASLPGSTAEQAEDRAAEVSAREAEVRRLEEEIRVLRQRLDDLERRVRELSGPR